MRKRNFNLGPYWVLCSFIVWSVLVPPLSGSCLAATTPLSPSSFKATGIFVLSGNTIDGNIRSYPFVQGYAFRWSWADIETQEGVYDFTAIDTVVQELEAKGLSLSLLLLPDDPAYLRTLPGVTTWSYVEENSNSSTYGQTIEKVVPWDSTLQARFASFMAALASHKIWSSVLNKKVAFRDDPALKNIMVSIPGYGELRPIPNVSLESIPGYTRTSFVNAVAQTLDTIRANFPNTHLFVPFWELEDSDRKDPLYDVLRQTIFSSFTNVGLYEDNLAAAANSSGAVTGYPNANCAEPLNESQQVTYTGFQALTSWSTPFTGQSKVAGGTPADGLNYAYRVFDTHYTELYVGDVDNQANWTSLTEVDSILNAFP